MAKTRRETILEAMKARITPMDVKDRDSQRPPETPWEQEQQSIIGTSVNHYSPSNPGGDSDYEVDSARQQWEMNPERDRINKEFLAKGDNAKWYNPDMSRTDYAGEGNPTLDVQRQTARNTYGNSAAPDLTPAPAPTPAPPPAPPMAPAGPTPTMQAFQAARLRKAPAPIDFTPSQAVSGYQSGGYTGGTSNG